MPNVGEPGGPSPWLPEPNILVHQVIGKLGEESCELGKECFRILIQGINEVDPSTGEPNRKKLINEMGDVLSKIEAARDLLRLDPITLRARKNEKDAYHKPWWDFLIWKEFERGKLSE